MMWFGHLAEQSRTASHTCRAALLPVQEAFQREVAILKACRNRNIVAFLGEYVDTERTWLIMEYMEVGFGRTLHC